MYIRSQDKKTLVKLDHLTVEKSDKKNIWVIFSHMRDILGYYASESNARGVLDEIETALKSCSTIYLMPVDDEVDLEKMRRT